SNDATLGTIAGIRNWHEWSWPDNETEAGHIYARSLPGIGPWKKFTPENIQKIVKKRVVKKPEPTVTTHSHLSKSWTMPMPEIQGLFRAAYIAGFIQDFYFIDGINLW
ncbi:23398_t:CDS:2, partial [Gigaspora rosea]